MATLHLHDSIKRPEDSSDGVLALNSMMPWGQAPFHNMGTVGASQAYSRTAITPRAALTSGQQTARQPLYGYIQVSSTKLYLALFHDPVQFTSAARSKASTPVGADVDTQIRRLLRLWNLDEQYSSAPADISDHPAFEAIVGFGREAVATLLNAIDEMPHECMAALEAVTGEDPVSVENYGDIEAMCHDWKAWGVRYDY